MISARESTPQTVSTQSSDDIDASGDDILGSVAADLPQSSETQSPDLVKTVIGADAGMSKTTHTLEQMADATAPIVDIFTEILVFIYESSVYCNITNPVLLQKEPYAKDYSACLSTAPVIGLNGNNIMYVNQKSTDTDDGFVEEWSIFSGLPSNVSLEAGKAVHFFPYKGDFCLSIGRAV